MRYHSQKIKIQCGGVARTETRALITAGRFGFLGPAVISTGMTGLAFEGISCGGWDSLDVMAVKSIRDFPLIGVGEIVDRGGEKCLANWGTFEVDCLGDLVE